MIRRLQKGLMMAMVVVTLTGLVLLPGQRDAAAFSTVDLNEQLVMATLWMQTSAEYRALCYQTFNLAKLNLQAFLSYYKGEKAVAVIVDADETVIDNGAYEAFLIGNDFGFSSKTWTPWMAAAQAEAVPGALDFLTFASEQGVEIFYVTNRKTVGYEGTEKNLAALGFPNVDQKHLLLRTDTSDKQPRRDIVTADFEVAFLMGDNLNDFESVFAKKSVAERFAAVDERKAKWGSKFIVLPNPTYGEWEGAMYNYNWGASAAEKDKMRKELLKRWNYTP